LAERRGIGEASLLSFVAAFVDSCGFVGLFGLFTSHVTGNFVMIGAEVIQHHGELVSKILAMPVFVLAVVATAKAVPMLRRKGHEPLAWLLRFQAILLALSSASATFLPAPSGPDSATTMIAGMLAVAAMGLQNALMRLELTTLPATTVMTVTVTQTAIDALALWSGSADDQRKTRERFGRRPSRPARG
jgi:uncharacterized membrane protein YoaK (UPF0700 family)